jgi:hypothetical protein
LTLGLPITTPHELFNTQHRSGQLGPADQQNEHANEVEAESGEVRRVTADERERAVAVELCALTAKRGRALRSGVRRFADDPAADKLVREQPARLLGMLAQQRRSLRARPDPALVRRVGPAFLDRLLGLVQAVRDLWTGLVQAVLDQRTGLVHGRRTHGQTWSSRTKRARFGRVQSSVAWSTPASRPSTGRAT